jgi:hypothetical protein
MLRSCPEPYLVRVKEGLVKERDAVEKKRKKKKGLAVVLGD